MFFAPGIESAAARRACGVTFYIFANCKLVPAGPAEYSAFVEFADGPNPGVMVCDRRVTFIARVPAAAALELDGDNIQLAVVMNAPRLRADLDAINLHAENSPHQTPNNMNRTDHRQALLRDRDLTPGQTEN
jgi:hypothetical protein